MNSQHEHQTTGGISSSEGFASRYFQQFDGERFFYSAKAGRVERSMGLPEGQTSHHPCVKPLAVCRYLARLIRPPEKCDAALLMPFCGSGSEMIGALLAGWRNVTGIDITPEYVDIARARIKWWQDAMQSTGLTEPRAILKAMKKRKPTPLFDFAEAAE